MEEIMANEVTIALPGNIELKGLLAIPKEAKTLVVFAHGSGSSRYSPRNQHVGNYLFKQHLAYLLLDLLTPDEEARDEVTREIRFDIPLLAERLSAVAKWLGQNPSTQHLSNSYFGSSTGAAAALIAAAEEESDIAAIVSRGGRPDLALPVIDRVKAPTLLIVGGNDFGVIELNQQAYDQLKSEKELAIIEGATHLFEEPGALDKVAHLAGEWFKKYSR